MLDGVTPHPNGPRKGSHAGQEHRYRPRRSRGPSQPCRGTAHLSHHSQPDRQVWLQEFGAAPQWIPAAAIPEFAEASIAAALTCGRLWGITWWASHDIDRGLTGFADLEYELGLLTTANEPKPTGQHLARVIDHLRDHPPTPAPRTTALLLDGTHAPDWSFADRFFSLIDQGTHPAIVLAAHRDDPAHLEGRGITEIIES
ncbi:hypothetical protein ACIQNU_32425 [Streptomyces sp. NPDC091292]|uniref:hypothetical protein n=1 Tax=Streptomyces sp. NPDC091292 TaxID=3365991 RepID=UPI0038246DB6